MNSLPSFTRACTRRSSSLAFRPASNKMRAPPSGLTTSTSSTTSRTATKSTPLPRSQTPIQNRHLSTAISSSSTTTTTTSVDLPPSLPPNQPRNPQPLHLQSTSPFLLVGKVTRTGTMTHCVQITRQLQTFDPFLQKHYTRPVRSLIHDPNPPGYLREGDVVEFGPWSQQERQARLDRKEEWERKIAEEGAKAKKKKRGGKKLERTRWRGPTMVVRRVVTAFGVGVDERMGGLVEQERVKAQAELMVEEGNALTQRGRKTQGLGLERKGRKSPESGR